ncbi:MAG: alpha-2-macroglobulin family protein [Rhodobacteraceae bacterium]|nr:alpha-2-macroglobulin family protein [Paracoccaceae bacterium]
MRTILKPLAIWFMAATASWAQQAVPDARFVVTPDTDFYGADLQPLFDTDLRSCIRVCSGDVSCAAFTFNTRSNACFPKSGVETETAYAGAVSARKVATAPDSLSRAAGLAARLEFLNDQDMARALRQGAELGFRHRAGGLDAQTATDAAAERRAAGDTEAAMRWTGAAVSLTDRGDLWAEYARLLLAIGETDDGRRRALADRAALAAINGYLRGASGPARALALERLAQALERVGRGRDAIPALRLALSEAPRDDLASALDRAIGQYGFRVTDITVESDAAAPRICAEFSEPLIRAGTDYDPFVRRSDARLAVQVSDRTLCLDGVEHGARHVFTLRRGLPAASGETLHRDVEIAQYVRDRSAAVRFAGRAYVLPRTAGAFLPVETVNVETLDLTLRRVSDRNLLRAMQDGFFGRPLSYYDEQTFATDLAEQIWTGTARVQSDLNRDMTTRLPMGDVIGDLPAGIYALSARVPGGEDYDAPRATQWFVLSDLGISTAQGSDGLHVWVRGLSDAGPRGEVRVTLVSRANAVLAQAETDAAGFVSLPPGLLRGTGGAAPALLLAEQGTGDLGFVALTDPGFDLSDRGVEGRPPAGPVDVFLTTDRGAYRAGERIHATVLARDDAAAALTGVPLTAVLTRPDGVEHLRLVSGDGTAGGHVFAMDLGPTVPRGTWRLEIRTDPQGEALARQTVLVEDFLPERIDFDLSLPGTGLRAGDTIPLGVQADYLFGAPGADLPVEGTVSLRPAQTVDGWPGFRFGRHDAENTPVSAYFGDVRTDASGGAQVPVTLPRGPVEGQMTEARFTVRVAEGTGRPVEREVVAPVAPDTPVIGLRPIFRDVVPEGGSASFEVVALAPDLTPLAMPVRWTLNRVETRYEWYQLYGEWNWEPTTRRTRVATGETRLGAAPVVVSAPVDWGRYEMVVERLGGEYTAASRDFHAGWHAPAAGSPTPDRLEVALDRADYALGDVAQLRIVARTAGTVLVSVMSNRLIARQTVAVDAGETRVPLDVTDDWGSGAYVTATLIRPMDAASGQNPARALGLAHARVRPGERALGVAIETPDLVRPRGTLRARVAVEGIAPGETAHLTLAAVDVGILNMTGFAAPDPAGHYFGQRRLGMELRDVYGRLIDGLNGAMGTVRSGGDSNAARMQSPPPTQDLMAVFSGLVTVDANGMAEVPLELPDFNGTLRLMAVVWSGSAVGQASRDVLVRDPVVVTAGLPRFLAPGDTSRVRLEIVHADGPAGAMQIDLTSTPGLTLGQGRTAFDLLGGGSHVAVVPVTAGAVPGDHQMTIALTLPDGQVLRQILRLAVRANDPQVAATRRFTLDAGDSFTLTHDVLTDYIPGSGTALVSAGALGRFDAPGLLGQLDRYPYGCTEQVASQAMPLLYLGAVARAVGLGDGPAVDARIASAIERVLTRQSANGAFGLWRAQSGEFWLDAYVTDFLGRARALGHAVPDRAFALAMDNLRNRLAYAPDFDSGGEDIAYALMVLAREGAAAMGDLRYYADVKADALATPLAVAQLGAALAAYGDQLRADALFGRAMRMIDVQPDEAPVWRGDYGTGLRDAAGVLTLAAEAGSTAVDLAALTRRVGTGAGSQRSTQEAAWSLLAAQALIASDGAAALRVNGTPVSGPFVRMVDSAMRDTSYALTAADRTEITLTTIGVPLVAPPAGGTGYTIARDHYTLDGQSLDPARMRLGDRFVTVLTVVPTAGAAGRLMIDDPLPAGIEIDNPNLIRAGDLRDLQWLEPSFAEHAEFRTDRFLAAVDSIAAGQITLAYVARAVSPGTFHHPAASVEDMYRPAFRARTATGRVVIAE